MSPKRVRVGILLILSVGMLYTFSLHIYYNAFYTSPLWRPDRIGDAYWDVDRLILRKVFDQRFLDMGLKDGDVFSCVVDARGREWPIRSLDSRGDSARALRWGEPWDLVVLRPDAKGHERVVTLPMPAEEEPPSQWLPKLSGLLPVALLALLCFGTALAIGFARAEDDAAYTASLLFICVPCFLLSLWGGRWFLFPPVIREVTAILWIYLHGLTMFLFLRFFLVFPSPSPLERRAPWLKRWALFTSLVFATWNLAWWLAQRKAPVFWRDFFIGLDWLDIVQDLLFVTLFLMGLVSLGLNIQEAKTPDERRRLALLLWGSFGIIPSLLYWLVNITVGFGLPLGVLVVIMLPGFAFPILFLYAVVKHRIFGIRFYLRRGLQFAFLSKGVLFFEGVAIFLVLYFAAAPTLAAALGAAGQSVVAIATAAAAAGAVLGIRQVNRKVMPKIEKRFFREAYDVRRILTEFTMGVRRFVVDPDALVEAVARTVSGALHPSGVAVFLRASKVLELPWDSERMKVLRRAVAGLDPADLLCIWRVGDGACAAPLLKKSALVSRLLAENALGEPSVLDVDPGSSRSRWSLLKATGSAEEMAMLQGLDAHLLIPLAASDRLEGFLCLGEKLSEEPYSREDAELLLAVAQQAADTLDHASLLRQTQDQAQLRREVEIAQQVQENLLPQEVIPVANLDYAGACRPARYVGGDYYDFILRGEGKLGIALGDISGKGVSAALLMASLQATLRTQVDVHGEQLEEVVASINRRLCSTTGETRFATLFYGLFDSETRQLAYVNAGHNPPMVLRPSPKGPEVTYLKASGTLLGIFENLDFRKETVQFDPGDVLLIYSDGATEAMNEAKDFFGEERLEKLMTSLTDLPAVRAVERVLEELALFTGEYPQTDDITLIVARVL